MFMVEAAKSEEYNDQNLVKVTRCPQTKKTKQDKNKPFSFAICFWKQTSPYESTAQ